MRMPRWGKHVFLQVILSYFSFRYGLESLFRFYSYGLEKKFRPEIFKHFMQEVKSDVENKQLYGLEKLFVFMRRFDL